MATSLNSNRQKRINVLISGYLVSKPTSSYRSISGSSVATLVIAVEPEAINRNAQTYNRTDIVFVKVWGALAELCKNELRVGDHIEAEGALRSRKFRTSDGMLRYITEVEAAMVTPIHPSHDLN